MGICRVIWFTFILAVAFGCNSRDYGDGGTVCVCSKTDCDTIKKPLTLPKGQYQMYTSSKSGKRFARNVNTFRRYRNDGDNSTIVNTININRNEKFQKIFGFGGAFTDSAGINILTLSPDTRETLMKAYYSEDGLQYSMGRVPIGGTDFSTRGYTLDDVVDDLKLDFFSLQLEDYRYKIPLIQYAKELTNGDLKLFASAWTAPAWMKTNNNLIGIGFLNTSMFDLWAQYHVKFFDAYREQNINFWGLTTGNEPANGYNPYFPINDMGWVPSLQAQWISENLGPKIKTNPFYYNMKIMIVDDQRVYFPWVPRFIMRQKNAAAFIDGSAVHYYTDQYVSADVLTITHYDFPDKFILATEGCEGSLVKRPVILGSWLRAENYLNSIIDDLNNWSTGWMDWNIALNVHGGPTYAKNFVDSPIIVNKTADEFYKQPMFYALGHFSKFIRPDSRRVKSECVNQTDDFKFVAFEYNNSIILSIFNPNDWDITVNIKDSYTDGQIKTTIENHSITSILFE